LEEQRYCGRGGLAVVRNLVMALAGSAQIDDAPMGDAGSKSVYRCSWPMNV